MPSAKTAKAGQGLSALARQDFLARVRKDSDQRIAQVMANVRGKAGTLKTAQLEAVKTKNSKPLDFSVAVLQLHGYEVQIDGDTVRYAVPRAIVNEITPQAKPEPIVKAA